MVEMLPIRTLEREHALERDGGGLLRRGGARQSGTDDHVPRVVVPAFAAAVLRLIHHIRAAGVLGEGEFGGHGMHLRQV